MNDWRFFVFVVLAMCRAKDDNNNLLKNTTATEELKNYRLSPHVLPLEYIITLSPDFSSGKFQGEVRINIRLLERQDHLAVHSKNLTINSQSVESAAGKIPVKFVEHAEKFNLFVIHTVDVLEAGNYSLGINFTGSMTETMNGMYLSSYFHEGDQSVRKLLVTQFEPIYARKAFPCFDEPSFKSIFHIRLVYRSENRYRPFSNMPVASVKKIRPDNGSEVLVSFMSSLPMPSYLVAIAISDFECSSARIDGVNKHRPVPIRICTKPNSRSELEFPGFVAVRALQYFRSIFEMDYPLPKIDLLAVPDFAAGAMENWGLVTFRETELLCKLNDSYANLRRVASTVAHEFAHMWFGDLVTLKRWDDLWLNEGFATYVQHLALDFLFSDWNHIQSFPLFVKYSAMRHDCKHSAHPIVRRAADPEEIRKMFDRITYDKAAAVIRMLENAMGNFKFMHALKKYLRKFRLSNAESRDVLQIFASVCRCGVDVEGFFYRWMKTPGFPVVNVLRDGKSFRLTQRRFLLYGKSSKDYSESWDIPIKYVTNRQGDGVGFDWFLSNFTCVTMSLEYPVEYIKLNHNSVGYYIVNYTENAWEMFARMLLENTEALGPLDRGDLLHDALIMADAGDLRYSIALDLTVCLARERNLRVWAVGEQWFARTNQLLRGSILRETFQSYVRFLVRDVYQEIQWDVPETESFEDREFRSIILKIACEAGHDNCLKTAGEKLKDYLESDGIKTIDPDTRSIVYSYGLVSMQEQTETMFDKMWQMYLKEKDVQEKERLINGLTTVRNKDMINRLIENVHEKNLIRRQDVFEILLKIAHNPEGLDIVWNFFRSNWPSLLKKYGLSDSAMGASFTATISLFKTDEKLREVREFLKKNSKNVEGLNFGKNAVEEIEYNINWLSANVPQMNLWLRAKGFTSDRIK